MKVVSLFSGGGLGDLGFVMAGCEIVAQVEIDEYCQKILALRYPDAKKFRDIRAVKGGDLPECDIITGGFPCQPFSVAGKQKGKDDNRHLWPEMFRIISEVRPTWVVGENVSGFVRIALDDVLSDLESIGYETTTIVFPAHALGAPHRRERVWIIAHATKSGTGENEQGIRGLSDGCGERIQAKSLGYTGLLGQKEHEKQTEGVEQSGQDVADTTEQGHEDRRRAPLGHTGEKKQEPKRCGSTQSELQNDTKRSALQGWWSTEPNVGRVAHGVPSRVDRLKCLGNGQVPYCTEFIARYLMTYEKENT